MASTLSKVKNRLERNGLSRTLKYIIFVVFLERFGIRISNEFILDAQLVDVEPAVLDGFTLEALNKMEQLSDSDREFLREYGEDTAF
jgi:hypothetical protein